MKNYSRVGGFDIELLNQSNYKIQKTYLESYPIKKDLWDMISNNTTTPQTETSETKDFKCKS